MFYVGATFIMLIADFYKMETIHFNIICQLSSLSGIKESSSAFGSIL
jgi:hypothetical protein